MGTSAITGAGRWFWPAVVALLLWTTVVRVVSALEETQTWDEGFHLAAGYSYLRTGDYRMRTENPPLGKLLNALPLLLWNPVVPTQDRSWQEAKLVEFGSVFLYQNRVSADQLLFAARCVTMLLSLLLGLAIALWTRRHFGDGAAWLACGLYCLDPNLIAHGRYVTSDLVAALTIFLACLAWFRYLEAPSRRALLAAGVTLGLALASKFTALALLPIFVILYLLRRWQGREGRSLGHLVKSFLWMGLISAALIAALYAPDTVKLFRGPPPPLARYIDQTTALGRAVRFPALVLRIPAHPYLLDFADFLNHVQAGHEAYLLGRIQRYGWWYYFPVAMALKTPVAALLLLAMAAAVSLKVLLRRGRREWLRRLSFKWLAVGVPPVALLGVAMSGGHNLGLRHVLPVYPFLYVAAAAVLMRPGAGLARRLRTGLAGALVLLAAVESFSIHPHYLAFFNFLVGGPGEGPRYLVDSNIDWGQDLKKLKRYLKAQGTDEVCLCYFGRAQPWYYGIKDQSIPATPEVRAGARPDCLVAISATPLQGVYVPLENFRWLRERKPDAKVGYSIYVYDLRRNKKSP